MSQAKCFKYKDGYLHCEDLRVSILQEDLDATLPYSSPFYLFSESQIQDNVNSYLGPFRELARPHLLGFAVKSNFNPNILRLLHQNGCTAVTVSGNEIRMALAIGIPGHNIIYNGNGKLRADVETAVLHNCLINVDSGFDLHLIVNVCLNIKRQARVLMRVNPDINADTHHYLATGVGNTKFGIREDQLWLLIEEIEQNHKDLVKVVGLHCHLGSTIDNVGVFRKCLTIMLDLTDKLNSARKEPLGFLNIGGGLGINYNNNTSMPTAKDLVDVISELVPPSNMTLILEPGRSLIGNTAVLVTKVLGTKANGDKNFMILDGSMTEVVRPCLYDAYHHIALTEPSQVVGAQTKPYDVVGPVCECADYLGKGRYLEEPHIGCGAAVFDVGAYCASMGSNYNMRLRPAEVLVSQNKWRIIRNPDTLEDLLKPFNV